MSFYLALQFFVTLSVIILIAILKSVVMLGVAMVKVFMLSDIMLSVLSSVFYGGAIISYRVGNY